MISKRLQATSLQLKIMALLMLISTLLSMALGIIFYQNTINNARISKDKELLTLSALTASKIERFLFERAADAKVLAQSIIFTIPIDDVTDSARIHYLESMIQAYQAYDSVFILNRNGTVRLRAGYLETPVHQDVMTFQKRFLSKNTYMSDIREIDQDRYIYFSEPLYDARGAYLGAIVEVMNFDAIDDIITGVEIEETGHAYLSRLDQNTDSDQHYGIKQTVEAGKTYILAVSPLPQYESQTKQWVVTVRQELNDALIVKKDIERYFVYVVIGFLIFFYVLSAVISRYVTQPIRLLMKKANALMVKNQHFAADVIVTDEVKTLTNSFDLLLEELNFMMQQVLEKSGQAAHIDLIRNSVDELIEGMPSGIITVDQDGCITSINDYALDVLKLQEDMSVGKTIAEWDATHLSAFFKSLASIHRSHEKLRDAVCPIQLPDGTSMTLVYSILLQYDSHDHYIGMTILLNPLDAKRNFEESILRAKKLSELGELSAGVAHEIRNPLASIRGYAQLIQSEVQAEHQAASDIQVILNEVDRLDTIIDRFLTFARPNAPRLSLCHMNTIIQDTLDLLKQDEQIQNIKIRHRYSKHDLVMVDYEQMKQVFINLLLNAVQAMPKGGKIELVTLHSDQNKTMEIYIVDEGDGIPAEHLKKIFRPFYTTRSNGSGLGLSICSRIIENHNGIMEISSSTQGTQVIIKLPVAANPPESAPAERGKVNE